MQAGIPMVPATPLTSPIDIMACLNNTPAIRQSLAPELDYFWDFQQAAKMPNSIGKKEVYAVENRNHSDAAIGLYANWEHVVKATKGRPGAQQRGFSSIQAGLAHLATKYPSHPNVVRAMQLFSNAAPSPTYPPQSFSTPSQPNMGAATQFSGTSSTMVPLPQWEEKKNLFAGPEIIDLQDDSADDMEVAPVHATADQKRAMKRTREQRSPARPSEDLQSPPPEKHPQLRPCVHLVFIAAES